MSKPLIEWQPMHSAALCGKISVKSAWRALTAQNLSTGTKNVIIGHMIDIELGDPSRLSSPETAKQDQAMVDELKALVAEEKGNS